VIEIVGSYSGASFHDREDFEAEYGPVDPLYVDENFYGDVRLWFAGHAFSRPNALGRGVNIIGRGAYTFLFPSHALGGI
jgi:hypothetical protein